MKAKGNVLMTALIAMTSVASAQQVTSKQQSSVKAGTEVGVGKQGVSAGTSARIVHSGENSVTGQQEGKVSAKSDARVKQRAELDARPVLNEVRDGAVAVQGQQDAAKQAGAEAANQVAASADASANATAAAVAEGTGKVEQVASGAVSSLEGSVNSATEVDAALEGTVKSAMAAPVSGEVLQGQGGFNVKPAAAAKTLVNGSLKGVAPVKLDAAGSVNNAVKIKVLPLKAQVRNIAAGSISLL